jgi:hypothetical protein
VDAAIVGILDSVYDALAGETRRSSDAAPEAT